MERYNCTCHCCGSMFYKHLHDPSCDLFMHGEEAPQSKEAQLQAALDAERERVRQNLLTIMDLQAQLRQVEGAYQKLLNVIDDSHDEDLPIEIIEARDEAYKFLAAKDARKAVSSG